MTTPDIAKVAEGLSEAQRDCLFWLPDEPTHFPHGLPRERLQHMRGWGGKKGLAISAHDPAGATVSISAFGKSVRTHLQQGNTHD